MRYPTKNIVSLSLTILLVLSVQGCARTHVTPLSKSARIENVTPTMAPATDIPSPAPSFHEDLSCWPIKPLKEGEDIKGSIVFEGDNPAFAWDISSFRTQALEDNIDIASNAISSDGALVARLPFSEDRLALISSKQTKFYPLPEGKYDGVRFLSNGLIMIGGDRYDLLDNYKQGAGFTDKYYLLNPATGILTEGSVFLSGFSTGSLLDLFPIEYSPNMDYVIYKTIADNDQNYLIVQMDMKTGNVIWSGPFMPIWKPDGKTLVYLSSKEEKDTFGYFHHDNLYSISEDAKITQLTQFDRKSLSPLWGGLSWSPNGRYLAFQQTEPALSLFYIWDDQEKIAFRPCLPDENRAYPDYRTFWSFDNKHIFMRIAYPDLLAIPDPPESLTPKYYVDLILDMENKTILELPDDNNRGEYTSYASRVPVGWVNWEIP